MQDADDQAVEVEASGFGNLRNVLFNLEAPALCEAAVRRGEARFAKGGALVAETGALTGRSPNDKFIVRDALTDQAVWWQNSNALTSEQFGRLFADMLMHAQELKLFAQDLYAGADPASRVNVRVYTEYAWHSLFIRNLLIRPPRQEPNGHSPGFTVLALPSFPANPARHGCRSQTVIAVDYSRRIALIGGTGYAGEIKKAVFGYLNFLLPTQGVLPMHCAANCSDDGASALFFGLSGTGKTTLSTDPSRCLIGDDEHGWGREGVFNFEGGCYAKAINLSRELEPEIFAAASRFGAVLENVVMDPLTRTPDFDDGSITENTRIAYPLDFIVNASQSGRAGHPKNIVMLACDAFGVLPPISKLNAGQAIYHFLSGYTAKVAGTEKGVREPRATFSTCFGAPFMPRHPSEYGNLLRQLIDRHKVDCWLLNTGWTGGQFGVGRRMPITLTRTLLRAALDGSLAKRAFHVEPNFGLSTPTSLPDVEAHVLDGQNGWASSKGFADMAERLVGMFHANFVTFEPYVSADVLAAAPRRASGD
jgi:phosphoenolpyruvate carboxykinase (ATP)